MFHETYSPCPNARYEIIHKNPPILYPMLKMASGSTPAKESGPFKDDQQKKNPS